MVKPAATYYCGKTVVQVMAPAMLTEEEWKKRLTELHQATWDTWDSLGIETRLQINSEYTGKIKAGK